MKFDVTVWGLRVEGELAEYDYPEAVYGHKLYDLDMIGNISVFPEKGPHATLPDEASLRLAEWSEFREAVLEAALEALDNDDS